jgi:hypothetical protein
MYTTSHQSISRHAVFVYNNNHHVRSGQWEICRYQVPQRVVLVTLVTLSFDAFAFVWTTAMELNLSVVLAVLGALLFR